MMKPELAEVLKVLNVAFLQRSLHALAVTPLFADKLAFGFRSGGCSEKPFQYEWAFVLDRSLEDERSPLRVVCEQKLVDIGLRLLPPASEDSRLRGGIQLKVYGSWYVSPAQVEKFKGDIGKVCNCDIPSVAVVACIFAKSSSAKDNPYVWIDSKKQDKWRLGDPIELEARMREFGVDSLTAITPTPLALENRHFRQLDLWVGAFFNKAASSLPDHE